MTMTMTPQEQPDPRDYKIEALKQRISELVREYEDDSANKRVEITFLSMRIQELEAKVNAFETSQIEAQESAKLPD